MSTSSRLSRTSILLVILLNLVAVHSIASPDPGALIFARQNGNCIQNCPTDPPTCQCAEDERCELVAQNCVECSKMICKKLKSSSNKVSTGTIVGATLGGVAMVGILGFLMFKTYSKKRPPRGWVSTLAEKDSDSAILKSVRSSTHTVASIATTVRTRASNIIQIAYIPGVTNRSAPSTPTHKIPPVPPLPFPDSPVGSQYPQSSVGDIQFAADDLLRASLCTVDNRSSIATTIYGAGAVVSQPNIVRAGKAAVVTVKGGANSNNSNSVSPVGDDVPPVPYLAPNSTAQTTEKNPPPSPAFSIGSTFMAGVGSREVQR